MMQVMPTKMVKAGQIVFKEGDSPDGLYFICYGTVEVVRNEMGKEVILAELGEESVFGEMALINSMPRNATVRTKTDCGFYVMQVQAFQHQVEKLDPVMRGVFRIFVLSIRGFLMERARMAEILSASQSGGGSGSGGGDEPPSRKLLF